MKPTENEEQLRIRDLAIDRHDEDSALFFNRYRSFEQGKYTDEFIYGRFQILDEIRKDLELLPVGAKVLDVGAGTGHIAAMLQAKGFRVTGLEPSREMLRYARQEFPDIEFVEGVSASLPFPDATFDYILSIEVLRYLHEADVLQTYREYRRVLKPGGRFLVTHVNRYALDFYYFFYHAKKAAATLCGKDYMACYFTTGRREEQLLKTAGFPRAESVGRLHAPVRIYFKLGKSVGRALTKFVERFNSGQRSTSPLRMDLSGHLIVRGMK